MQIAADSSYLSPNRELRRSDCLGITLLSRFDTTESNHSTAQVQETQASSDAATERLWSTANKGCGLSFCATGEQHNRSAETNRCPSLMNSRAGTTQMRLYSDDEGTQTRAATTERKRTLTRVKRRNEHEERCDQSDSYEGRKTLVDANKVFALERVCAIGL